MKRYVKKRGDRYYGVIYEGRDPVTGKGLAVDPPGLNPRAEQRAWTAAQVAIVPGGRLRASPVPRVVAGGDDGDAPG